MSQTLFDLLGEDVGILLSRALKDKTLTFFGEDGAGKYGQSTYPITANVCGVEIELTCSDEDAPSDIVGIVRLHMEGYDSDITGHAITDLNLRICLNERLAAEHIDPQCLTWGALSEQGKNYITLDVDVGLLLDWA